MPYTVFLYFPNFCCKKMEREILEKPGGKRYTKEMPENGSKGRFSRIESWDDGSRHLKVRKRYEREADKE